MVNRFPYCYLVNMLYYKTWIMYLFGIHDCTQLASDEKLAFDANM